MKKEEYQISTCVSDGIVEIAVTGTVTDHNISAFQQEIESIREKSGDMILLDVRSLVGRSETAFYHFRRPDKATGKTAVLDLPENENIKSNCEKIALCTSLQIKWFSDIDVAKNWLKLKEDKIRIHFDI